MSGHIGASHRYTSSAMVLRAVVKILHALSLEIHMNVIFGICQSVMKLLRDISGLTLTA